MKTSFEGFLPIYPFNVVHTVDMYPIAMRKEDAELDVDKAMMLLVTAENQTEMIVKSLPFEPTSHGLKETAYGMYEREDNENYKLLYSPNNRSEYAHTAIIPEADGTFTKVTVDLPNDTVAQVVLRSIGFLPMLEAHVPDEKKEDEVEFEEVPVITTNGDFKMHQMKVSDPGEEPKIITEGDDLPSQH